MVVETATLSFHERLGVSYTILAASCSLAATLSVLAYAGFRSAKRWIETWRGKPCLVRPSNVVDSALFINLMLMDVLEALAALPNINWMNDAMVIDGSLCAAQAVFKHIGGLGMATASLAIAIHGFSIIVLDWRPRRYATAIIITVVWSFTALMVMIPNLLVRHGLYGPLSFWCFMIDKHKWIQIFSYYFWLWLHGSLMILLYSIMFAVVRGWLVVDNGKIHWYRNYQPAEDDGWEEAEESDEDKEIKAIAKMMLFYPAVYVGTILPNTLNRWLFYSGKKSPYQLAIVANILHVGSGVFDVALFLSTRPKIIGHGTTNSSTSNNKPDAIQMMPTTNPIDLGMHGHLPTRHTNLTADLLHKGAAEYLYGGRGNKAPLTQRQDQAVQVEYSCSSNNQHESSNTTALQDPSLHLSLRKLGPDTEVNRRSVSGGGYVPPAGWGQSRTGAPALTGMEEEEDLGHLPG